MVQVDEHKIALIGGINDDDTDLITEIDIYDFDTGMWDSTLS